MHTLRTRFARDIVTEFSPPLRAMKKQRVIILCDGAPSVPSKKTLMEFLAKKGFWVFHPRYRGTWESNGKFLQYSLEQDLLAIISQLPKGFIDVWNKTKFSVRPDQIILLGGSFGGPAQLLASLDKRVSKAVIFSTVIDWTIPSQDEPLPALERIFSIGFGQGYRVVKNGWKKLASGKFYNPINHVEKFNGTKILLIHAKDDTVTPYKPVAKFAKHTQSKLVTLPKGGHLGTSLILKPRFYKLFQNFIKS